MNRIFKFVVKSVMLGTFCLILNIPPSQAQGTFGPVYFGPPSPPAVTECKIRVLFLYSATAITEIRANNHIAAADRPGDANWNTYNTIEAVSEEAITMLNFAFQQSNVDDNATGIETEFALAGYVEITDALAREGVTGGLGDLDWWYAEDITFCNVMSNAYVENLREITGADVIVLVKNNTNGFSRVWQIGATADKSAIIMNPSHMLVTNPVSGAAYTVPHEFGHVFGCDHDIWNGTFNGQSLHNVCMQPNSHGPASTIQTGTGPSGVGEGRGRIWDNGGTWERTIMAYNFNGPGPDLIRWPNPANTPELNSITYSDGGGGMNCRDHIEDQDGAVSDFVQSPNVLNFVGFDLQGHERIFPVASRSVIVGSPYIAGAPRQPEDVAGNMTVLSNSAQLYNIEISSNTVTSVIEIGTIAGSSQNVPCVDAAGAVLPPIPKTQDPNKIATGSVERKSGHGLQLISMFPNPTNLETQIEFSLDKEGTFHTELVSVLGNVVKRSPSRTLKKGNYREFIQVGDLPSGTYLLRMHMADLGFLSTKLMVLK